MNLRELGYLAEDVVKVGKWLVREVLDELDSRLAPRHVQRGWDAVLAEEEASREVWEPGEASLLSWGVDGATTLPYSPLWDEYLCSNCGLYRGEHTLAQGGDVAVDGDMLCPKQFTRFEAMPGSSRCSKFYGVEPSVSPVASAADVPPSVAVGEGPSEVCGDPPPPSEGLPLADLIAEVLAEPWREHVAEVSAERIANAIPAGVQRGDLIHAAGVVKAYLALGPLEDRTERDYLRALADRLADAGRPAFTP